MILCLLVWYINENNDKNVKKDTLSTVLYLSSTIIWYFILYTLFLANVKRIMGMGTASENTINIILWGTIIFVATQIISRKYIYEDTLKNRRINRKTYLLHRSWVPVTSMTFIVIIFLLFLYMSNLERINNIFKTFIIPFIVLIGIVITGIVSHFNNNKSRDTVENDEIEEDEEIEEEEIDRLARIAGAAAAAAASEQ
jgi:cytochrome bd-type quinol oxidase subunit 2